MTIEQHDRFYKNRSLLPFSPEFSPENKDAWNRAVASVEALEDEALSLWSVRQRMAARKEIYKNIILKSQSVVTA